MHLIPEPAKVKNRRSCGARIVVGMMVLLLLAVAGLFGLLARYALTEAPALDQPEVTVFIPRGTSVREIGGLLAEAGLIEEDVRFLLLTRIMGVSTRLQAGEFSLHGGQTPIEVIRELGRARPKAHLVTIPEGFNVVEIATLFANEHWADKERFIALSQDAVFIGSLGLGAVPSLEGYLFPDTYSLTRPAVSEEELLTKLVRRALSVWRELAHTRSSFTRHEVFTLASIVEKETAEPAERPLIAAVFINRLKKKMRLQSDPTVGYGIPGFTGPLTRAHLQTPTPYNTYYIPALPLGPICSPGRAALSAVLSPAESKYLYFVSKNDGTHYFSTTLQEHNRAVAAYQRRSKHSGGD